jgi:hypothetical protein
MANARREHDHDVAIATICHLGASFAGQFRPAGANPYRDEPPKSEAQKKAESDEGWERLKGGLAWIAEHSHRGP